MKKILMVGITVLFALFLVTCEEFFPNDEEAEYTDVVYSDDGSQVTLYLDGVGVPATRAQRAMSTKLAKIAYDYLEVIFIGSGTSNVARTAWELGEPAGISGVQKGQDYFWTTGDTTAVALMFVGRKDDKTLFGIGRIGEVDHSATTAPDAATWDAAKLANATDYTGTFATGINASGLPSTVYAYVAKDSKSVTFYIEAVKTGLLAVPNLGNTNGTYAWFDSFDFDGVYGTSTLAASFLPWDRDNYSSYLTLGGTDYPIYSLPQVKDFASVDDGTKVKAKYTFSGGVDTYKGEIRYAKAPTIAGGGIVIQKRLPRYMDGGRYRTPRDKFDLKSEVTLGTFATVPVINGAINPVVPLVFEINASGIMSFFIEMPVYMISNAEPTNTNGTKAEIWKLRTGFGSELYSLDDGLLGGGCVLMSIGASASDWLDIEWEWLK